MYFYKKKLSMLLLFSCIVILYAIVILSALYGWQKPISNKSILDPKKLCTIVIAARNEENNIFQTILDLVNQTYPSHNIQILIANDHSTDATKEIIESLAQKHTNIQVFSMPENIHGKKQSLAYVLPQATGDYILFTDADCSIPPSWVETYMTYVQNNTGNIFFGGVSHHKEKQLIQQFFTLDFIAMVGVQGGLAKINHAFSCNAANMCISREFYKTAYKTNPQYDSGDDVFLLHTAKQIKNSSVHFIQTNTATVITQAPHTIRAFIQQRIRWSSKATGYSDTDAIIVSVVVYAMSFTICCTALFSIFWSQYISVLLVLLGTKTIIDSLLFIKILPHYNKSHLIWLAPLFQCFYVIYITFIPIFAVLIPIQWKHRNIR